MNFQNRIKKSENFIELDMNFSLCFALLFFSSLHVFAQCPIGQSYSCWDTTCAAYSCSCSESGVDAPSINVKELPFQWQNNDTNTGNDTCPNTSCNCNKGTTSYSASALPAPSGACIWSNNKTLPAQVTCKWKDGKCNETCTTYNQDCGCN